MKAIVSIILFICLAWWLVVSLWREQKKLNADIEERERALEKTIERIFKEGGRA